MTRQNTPLHPKTALLTAALVCGVCVTMLMLQMPREEFSSGRPGEELRQAVRQEAPDIVVLGNCVGETLIDIPTLENVSGKKALSLAAQGRDSAYWYTLLSHVLGGTLAEGSQVVIAYEPPVLTDPKRRTEGGFRQQINDLQVSEDIRIDQIIAGDHGPGLLTRARQTFDSLRNNGIKKKWQCLVTSPFSLAGVFEGCVEDDLAATRLFHPLNKIPSAIEAERRAFDPETATNEELVDALEKSFVPELIIAARQHGFDLWFVGAPNWALRYGPDYTRIMDAWFIERGIPHLNLYGQEGVAREAWADAIHPMHQVKKDLTRAIAKFLD